LLKGGTVTGPTQQHFSGACPVGYNWLGLLHYRYDDIVEEIKVTTVSRNCILENSHIV